MKCKGVKNVENKWFSSKKEFRSHRQTHKKKTNDDEEVDVLGIDLDTIELELI